MPRSGVRWTMLDGSGQRDGIAAAFATPTGRIDPMRQQLRTTAMIAIVLSLSLAPAVAKKPKKEVEPDRVVVQHFLIGFNKSIKHKKIERTKKEAGKLAEELYHRALDGEDSVQVIVLVLEQLR